MFMKATKEKEAQGKQRRKRYKMQKKKIVIKLNTKKFSPEDMCTC